jgi:hypothetical protein
MKDERVLQLLRAACRQAGSQAKWARAHNIWPQAVSLVLRGRRRPGPQVLAALGLTRSITTSTTATYTRKAPADAE